MKASFKLIDILKPRATGPVRRAARQVVPAKKKPSLSTYVFESESPKARLELATANVPDSVAVGQIFEIEISIDEPKPAAAPDPTAAPTPDPTAVAATE